MSDKPQRELSGILFENDKEHDKQPDLRGSACIDGVQMRVSAWRKQGANGEFLSLAFSKPQAT